MLKTYVISLDYPKRLMETLPEQGLLPIWSPGVNGKALTDKDIRENTTPGYGKVCPRTIIGCAMAHMRAWTSVLKNNDDYALIVEDDVYFVPDFKDKIGIVLQHVPRDFDMLYLGCFGCTTNVNLLTMIYNTMGYANVADKIETINPYITSPGTVMGAHAYIVSKKGARILLDNLQGRIHNWFTWCLQDLHHRGIIKRYATNPRLAFQTSTDTTVSANTSKIHPILLHQAVSRVYVDDGFTLKYVLGVAPYKFPLTLTFVVFIVFGIIAAFFRPSLLLLTAIFVAFSIPDVIYGSDIRSIALHYAAFVIPTALLLLLRAKRGVPK
jgi:GR25 family glycosyltransferase involved in LPS biosynthesis